MDIATTRRPPILLTNLASILFGFALFASLIGTAGYVEAPTATGYGSDASQIVAGLCLLPSGLLMLLLSPYAARIMQRVGAPLTLALGAVVVAVGWAMRLVLPGDVWLVVAATGVTGVGGRGEEPQRDLGRRARARVHDRHPASAACRPAPGRRRAQRSRRIRSPAGRKPARRYSGIDTSLGLRTTRTIPSSRHHPRTAAISAPPTPRRRRPGSTQTLAT